ILADRLPRFAEVSLDLPVLAFTLLVSLLAGVLAGLLPSIRFTRTDVNEALKQGQSRGSSESGGRTRQVLIISEVALSLILLVGAGLMIRTLFELGKVKAGFDPSDVLTMNVAIPSNKFATPAAQINFFNDVLQRIRVLPGVESAGAIDSLPLDGGGSHQPFSIEGQPVLPMADQPEVDVRLVSTGYLRSLHIPVMQGRDFSEGDALGRNNVTLISESLARRFFHGENPIGKHVTLTFFPNVTREIVGIVGNTKLESLNETRPVDVIYVPLSQLTSPPSEVWRSFGLTLTVRTNSDPRNAISAVTSAIHSAGPGLPVTDVRTMDDIIAQSVSPQRFNLILLGVFAALALVLAAVGIYSVLSYTVRRRVREIGIRMALGASHSAVLRMVLADGLKPILLGVAIGLGSAFALSRLVSSLVFGIRPSDPLTFSAVSLLLIAVGVLATILPAYRATRIEPVRTLREE
ncbi:MAG TPA: FtsX-like permease family protein, partial [Candidatus Acidoferrales bacterium]|nr:FtsX-like permease family protein [Candidatus Acidoferrales bacterium]